MAAGSGLLMQSTGAALKKIGVEAGPGGIRIDSEGRTSRPGVFAAGDCRTKEVRQLTTAAADGAVAALAACKYIEEMDE